MGDFKDHWECFSKRLKDDGVFEWSEFELLYLSGALRLVIADLVLEIILEDVSDGELLVFFVDGRQRIGDVHEDRGFIQLLHGELSSTDVTCRGRTHAPNETN